MSGKLFFFFFFYPDLNIQSYILRRSKNIHMALDSGLLLIVYNRLLISDIYKHWLSIN